MPIRKTVKEYKTEGSSINQSKGRSGRRRTERTQENINFHQEKLIEDSRISARKNDFERRNTKKDASWYSKKWRTYRRKQKLSEYIRNKDILCFRIKYRN